MKNKLMDFLSKHRDHVLWVVLILIAICVYVYKFGGSTTVYESFFAGLISSAAITFIVDFLTKWQQKKDISKIQLHMWKDIQWFLNDIINTWATICYFGSGYKDKKPLFELLDSNLLMECGYKLDLNSFYPDKFPPITWKKYLGDVSNLLKTNARNLLSIYQNVIPADVFSAIHEIMNGKEIAYFHFLSLTTENPYNKVKEVRGDNKSNESLKFLIDFFNSEVKKMNTESGLQEIELLFPREIVPTATSDKK